MWAVSIVTKFHGTLPTQKRYSGQSTSRSSSNSMSESKQRARRVSVISGSHCNSFASEEKRHWQPTKSENTSFFQTSVRQNSPHFSPSDSGRFLRYSASHAAQEIPDNDRRKHGIVYSSLVSGKLFLEFPGDSMHVRRCAEGLGMLRVVHIHSSVFAKLLQHLHDRSQFLLC